MDEVKSQFIPSRKASKILGIHPTTLRSLDKRGEIQTIRTPGNKRLYNVQLYIDENVSYQSTISLDKKSICYCRVSTHSQKDDLERQITYMQQQYPSYELITDIGSGINFKRKGLKTILELAHQGKLKVLVVAYKDRLCRFGFDLFEHILQTQSNATIMVLNDSNTSPEEEVVQDLLQIITVFSARVNGLRKYHTKIQKDKVVSKLSTNSNS
jgi:putative resolvase